MMCNRHGWAAPCPYCIDIEITRRTKLVEAKYEGVTVTHRHDETVAGDACLCFDVTVPMGTGATTVMAIKASVEETVKPFQFHLKGFYTYSEREEVI